MKASKLRDMTTDELQRQETLLMDQIFRLRFQIAASQAENPARIRLLRKDLARVKTVLRQMIGPARPEPARKTADRTAVAAAEATGKAQAPAAPKRKSKEDGRGAAEEPRKRAGRAAAGKSSRGAGATAKR